MTDRELLEAAAKAAKMPRSIWWWVDGILCKAGDIRSPWNPLTDDGDALRLAVKLGLQVTPEPEIACCTAGDPYGAEYFEERGEDMLANTRRAIVRAAAAIGEQQ